MSDPNTFDVELAHRHFSAFCFNEAWGFLDKESRTSEESEAMISLAHASLWHWNQRLDCTDKNRSISFWQLSRVYSMANEPIHAKKYADLCLHITPRDETFYLGFAYEALARAESVAGNSGEATLHLKKARELAHQITNQEDREMLVSDLDKLV